MRTDEHQSPRWFHRVIGLLFIIIGTGVIYIGAGLGVVLFIGSLLMASCFMAFGLIIFFTGMSIFSLIEHFIP